MPKTLIGYIAISLAIMGLYMVVLIWSVALGLRAPVIVLATLLTVAFGVGGIGGLLVAFKKIEM